jgi:hypothetical protein
VQLELAGLIGRGGHGGELEREQLRVGAGRQLAGLHGDAGVVGEDAAPQGLRAPDAIAHRPGARVVLGRGGGEKAPAGERAVEQVGDPDVHDRPQPR